MSADLQNKLLNYEESPPDGAWAELSAALDDQLSPSLSNRLLRFEAEPSITIWKKIDQSLSAPAPAQAPVVPFFRRYRRPLKITGAAAVFVFAAILISLTISKKTISETTNSLVTGKPPIRINTSQASVMPQPKTGVPSQLDHPIALHGQTDRQIALIASLYKGHKATLTNQFVPLIYDYPAPAAPAFGSFIPNDPEDAQPIADGRMDQYIVYTDEQGNAMRVPKKLFAAIACPINTLDCREKLRRLQKRMAAAAVNPCFNGVLDMADHLNENQ